MNLNELSTDHSLVDEDIGTYAMMDTTLIDLSGDMSDERAAAQLAAEYDAFSQKIAHASECIHVARSMRAALHQINPRVGMKPSEARVVAVALEGLKTSITGRRAKRLSYGLESLKSQMTDQQALQLAKEGIGSFIMDVIRSIIDAIVAMGRWIGEFISRLFSRDQQTGTRLDSVEKSFKETEQKSEKLDPRTKDIVKKNIDDVAKKHNIPQSAIPANPQAEKEVAEAIAKDLTQVATDPTKKVEPEQVQSFMRTHSAKIYKPTTDPAAVPDLHIGGKYYSTFKELVEWITDLQKEHIEKYLRATNHTNIQQVTDLITKIIHETESSVQRTDAAMDLVNAIFKPMEHELMGAKVVNGVKSATGTVTMGDYAIEATAPDTNSGGHIVERHLGASRLTVKKVNESVMQVPKEGLPRIELDDGKKMIEGLKSLRSHIVGTNLKALAKAQEDLLAEAKKLEREHQGDEELNHVSHFGVTAVNVFNNAFVSYIASTQVYISKIINQVTAVAAAAAGQERAVLIVCEGLEAMVAGDTQ